MAIKMVIKVRHPRGLPDIACPMIFCDVCDRRIEKAEHGLYMWDAPEGECEEEAFFKGRIPTEMYMVHKGYCADLVDERVPSGYAMTMELSCLPIYLAGNLGIKWKKARLLAAVGEEVA